MTNQILKDQGGEYYNVRMIVNKLLPPENFYTFKTGLKEKENEREKQEIEKVIDNVISHGSYWIGNSEKAYLAPVLISNDCRDEVLKNLSRTIETCSEYTQRAMIDFLKHSGGKESKKINEIDNQIK